jgi:hypothetical protein
LTRGKIYPDLHENPTVIPAKAGIQAGFLDSGFRQNDGKRAEMTTFML